MLVTHCIYCAQEGRQTKLVPIQHWGACPICSAEWLRSLGINPALFQETQTATAV